MSRILASYVTRVTRDPQPSTAAHLAELFQFGIEEPQEEARLRLQRFADVEVPRLMQEAADRKQKIDTSELREQRSFRSALTVQ